MRNLALIILAGIVCVLGLSLHTQSISIEALQRSLNSANQAAASANKLAASASLDLQARCARQAQKQFKIDGWANNKFAGFTDHYNSTLNKCFVEIGDTAVSNGVPMNSTTVSDAFEGKVYGTYMWINAQNKKYWEVAPTVCTVTLPSGEEKQCRSSEEFDDLVKQYMQ